MYNNTNTQKDKDGEHNAEEEKRKRKTVVKKQTKTACYGRDAFHIEAV